LKDSNYPEGGVRRDAKWRVVVLAVMGLAGCGSQTKVADNAIVLNWRDADTVRVTAACNASNQIDVAVDKWEIYMKKKGTVTLLLQPSGGASLELTQKSADLWPFDEPPPFKANGNGKVKDKKATYQYNVRVACVLPNGDSARVVIDPDIFVD
jgi:hypothetical protein